MALTNKQEQFVSGLIEGKTQRQAYKDAGYSVTGKSESYIDIRASELMKNSKVSVRYQEVKGRLIKEAEDESIITAKEVLMEIKSIAKDRISNYLDFYPDENSPNGIKIDIKDSRTIDVKNVSEISLGKDGQFKFKTYCRDAALYKLADMLGLMNGNGQKYVEGDNSSDESDLTVEELRQLAKNNPL